MLLIFTLTIRSLYSTSLMDEMEKALSTWHRTIPCKLLATAFTLGNERVNFAPLGTQMAAAKNL